MTQPTDTMAKHPENPHAEAEEAIVQERSISNVNPAAETSAGALHTGEGADRPKLDVRDLRFWYGDTNALKGITMQMRPNLVTAFIGPSGCGKSTLLRCFNRMNELIPDTHHEGNVLLDGQDVYQLDPVALRRVVGMVFQKPNPFPKSIYQNIAWGAKANGYKGNMEGLVERCLRRAALWDEVKDRLKDNAYGLSGGQQQRLCIARALAVEPNVLLMDEPASALDPVATGKLEETILELKESYTIVVVTHNMQQASRISDETAFFYLGEIVEMNVTEELFTNPAQKRTEEYITGRFG